MQLQNLSILRGVTLLPSSATNLSTATFEVFDPATSTPIARLAHLTATDCTTAIENALPALSALRSLSPRTCSFLLHRWHELVLAAQTDLATIITAENGKPAREALDEVQYAAEFLHWFAGEAQRIHCFTIACSAPNTRSTTIHQPVGIARIITPWNFTAAMVTRRVGAAIAAGCPCILKPAAETPLMAIALAALGAP